MPLRESRYDADSTGKREKPFRCVFSTRSASDKSGGQTSRTFIAMMAWPPSLSEAPSIRSLSFLITLFMRIHYFNHPDYLAIQAY